MNFDANKYADTVRLAGNAFRNADKNSSAWASQSLAAVMLGKLTIHAVAVKLYDEMNPLTAKGKTAAPKENDNGTISVSSLRGGGDNICKGGDAARKAFDKLQYIVNNADILPDETKAFAINGGSLDGLVASIKREKAKTAKAEAEAEAGETDTAKEGDEPEGNADGQPSFAERISAFNAMLASMTAEDCSDAVQLALADTMERMAELDAKLNAATVANMAVAA